MFKLIGLGMLVLPVAMFVIYSFYVVASYGTDVIKDKTLKDEIDIIAKVKSHVLVPNTEPISVMKVKNPDELKSSGGLYLEVKKDDYVVVYEDLIVVYDVESDKVVDINRKK